MPPRVVADRGDAARGIIHDGQLYGIGQTARFLGVSRNTVERWIASGALPIASLPGLRRVWGEQINRLRQADLRNPRGDEPAEAV